MPTYEEKKRDILNQYFNQYIDRIIPTMNTVRALLPNHLDGSLDLMYTMFLCSVADYFGKLMRVGRENSAVPTSPNGQAKQNFTFFVSQYFPAEERCKGDVLYSLFRNGVMHQYFPKASGVFWSNDPQYFPHLFSEREGILNLNNLSLEQCIRNGIQEITNNFQNDIYHAEVEAIYTHLIETHYGFDDHRKMEELRDQYRVAGRTFYDPCQHP